MSSSPDRASRLVVVGAGVVGRALAERLRVVEPERPLCLTARSAESVETLASAGFEARRLDVVTADEATLREVLGGARCVVFSVAAGRGGDYQAIYGNGTQRIARVLSGRDDVQFVYTSSTGVYAEDAGGWVDEEARLAEDDDRTRALVAAERNVRGTDGTVLRLSGILAPERGPHRRIEQLAGTTRDDGEAWLNLVPLPTIVDALVAVITRDWRGTVNVSGARPWRRRDYYDAVLARAGARPIEWIAPAPGSSLGRRVAVDRMRDELGVVPRDLDDVVSGS